MIIYSRRRNEAIVINDEITIMVVDVRGDSVRLGIEAPKEVPVHRGEVYAAIHGGENHPTDVVVQSPAKETDQVTLSPEQITFLNQAAQAVSGAAQIPVTRDHVCRAIVQGVVDSELQPEDLVSLEDLSAQVKEALKPAAAQSLSRNKSR